MTVRPATWSKVDALAVRVETGNDGISAELATQIEAQQQAAEAARQSAEDAKWDAAQSKFFTSYFYDGQKKASADDWKNWIGKRAQSGRLPPRGRPALRPLRGGLPGRRHRARRDRRAADRHRRRHHRAPGINLY